MTSRRSLYIAVAALAALSGFAAFFYTKATERTSFTACQTGAGNLFDDACLHETARALLASQSPRELIESLVAKDSSTKMRAGCHQIAHAIGEENFLLDNSTENALSRCTRSCNEGCFHGVVAAAVAREMGTTYPDVDIAHANLDVTLDLGKEYCDKTATLCHAVGHMLLMSYGELDAALRGCDTSAKGEALQSCHMGVYMEGGGLGTSFGKNAIMPEKDDFGFPCTDVGDRYKSACFVYLHDYQNNLFERAQTPAEQQFQIRRDVCESQTGTARHQCFFGMGFKMEQRASDVPGASARCASLSPEDSDWCIIGLEFSYASLDQVDNGLALCRSIASDERETLCYNVLFQRSERRQVLGRVVSLCESASDDGCLSHYGTYRTMDDSLPRYEYITVEQ